mgnify:CR=1 FL=1
MICEMDGFGVQRDCLLSLREFLSLNRSVGLAGVGDAGVDADISFLTDDGAILH